jgi:hypothetical protein
MRARLKVSPPATSSFIQLFEKTPTHTAHEPAAFCYPFHQLPQLEAASQTNDCQRQYCGMPSESAVQGDLSTEH